MKKHLYSILLVLFCAPFAFSQEAQPTQTPTPGDEGEVVRISTNLIQLDVTVTDSKGKIVTDLRPEEMEIYENGKLQKTSNFSFVTSSKVVTEKAEPKEKKLEVLTPPLTPVRPENVRRAIAIIVDDLTLSHSSSFWVKEALKKYVREQVEEGDLVAIIRTGAGIGALQQFTLDRRQLLAAVDKIHFNMSGSARISVFNPIEPSLLVALDGTRDQLGNRRDDDLDRNSESEFENDVHQFRESVFASGTLGAVNYVIRGMKDLPGRKSLILFSDGFSFVDRSGGWVRQDPHIMGLLRGLTDLANRASVVIHTIDPRGMQFEGLTAEDDTTGVSSGLVTSLLEDRQNSLRDTEDGLRYLSKETGGLAIANKIDLNRGIRRILDDQSYYLVGYQPDDETFDSKTRKYNKLSIKVTRPGTRVRYRSGFFGISEEQITKEPPRNLIYNALTSPFALNDISLKLNALYASNDKRDGYLRSFLHIDTKNLTFVKGPDGKHKTSFELLASTFGDNGAYIDGERSVYSMTITDEALEKVNKKGMVYQFAFPIKKAGAYQMRVAIRDTASNKVGSANQFVQIPNLKKNRLALSGVLLENVPVAVWKKRAAKAVLSAGETPDPVNDTAARQFKSGTVLSYALTIYNAKPGSAGVPSVTAQARLFDEKDVVFEGKPGPLEQSSSSEMLATGSMLLGSKLLPGNYTLQIVVTDNNVKGPKATAVQYLSFEIVE